MTDAFLQISSLNLSLGNFSLRNVSLSCVRGEYHVLLGPTGSGKSSLMKAVLGFYHIERGSVRLSGRDISRDRPENRRMGYVPQNYSLFPHLNVENNIRFGLRTGKHAVSNPDRIVNRLCEMLRIDELRSRYIRHLSGGERQKVALARALVIQPDFIFLDEPFASIDESAKRVLWIELKKIINEIGITALHITHNLEEAYSLGERLSVILDGRIHQSGEMREIFEHPATREVARFLNYRNLFPGVARAHPRGTMIDVGGFGVVVSKKIPDETTVHVCVRQQDVKVLKAGQPVREALKDNVFQGRIVSVFDFPEYCLVYFRMANSSRPFDFEIKLPPYLRERHNLFPGKEAAVALWEPNIIVF